MNFDRDAARLALRTDPSAMMVGELELNDESLAAFLSASSSDDDVVGVTFYESDLDLNPRGMLSDSISRPLHGPVIDQR